MYFGNFSFPPCVYAKEEQFASFNGINLEQTEFAKISGLFLSPVLKGNFLLFFPVKINETLTKILRVVT